MDNLKKLYEEKQKLKKRPSYFVTLEKLLKLEGYEVD
jgi:hypothetical protein